MTRIQRKRDMREKVQKHHASSASRVIKVQIHPSPTALVYKYSRNNCMQDPQMQDSLPNSHPHSTPNKHQPLNSRKTWGLQLAAYLVLFLLEAA